MNQSNNILQLLFELSENPSMLYVTNMYAVCWGEREETWKWRQRLFTWEEERRRW